MVRGVVRERGCRGRRIKRIFKYQPIYCTYFPYPIPGKYCQHMTTVKFVDPGSFVQISTPVIQPALNVTLGFTTRAPNGVLAYFGAGRKHLAVEVFKGRLRISYDVGNHPASTMFR